MCIYAITVACLPVTLSPVFVRGIPPVPGSSFPLLEQWHHKLRTAWKAPCLNDYLSVFSCRRKRKLHTMRQWDYHGRRLDNLYAGSCIERSMWCACFPNSPTKSRSTHESALGLAVGWPSVLAQAFFRTLCPVRIIMSNYGHLPCEFCYFY